MNELERLDFTRELIQRGRQAIPFKGTLRYWQVDSDLAQATWEWPEWKGCPTDQMYFWTAEWQRGERESLKALYEGDYVQFDGSDPDEVARWFAS